jgi:hypothetical protein
MNSNIFTSINDLEFNSITRNLGNYHAVFIFLSSWDPLSAQVREFILTKLRWETQVPVYIMDSFEAPESFGFFAVTSVPAMVVCSGRYRVKIYNTVSSIERELVNLSHLEVSSYN